MSPAINNGLRSLLTLFIRYACHADDLVNDFVSLTSLVTKENLQTLEASYNQSQGVPTGISFPQMQAAASRFLGRLWAGSSSYNSTKSVALSPGASSASRPTSTVRRSTSKQSMASTLNSLESNSDASTAPTDVSNSSNGPDVRKPRAKSTMFQHTDKDLHGQIEDLLMALSDLQREQADLARELQKEREERQEDQEVAKSMLKYIQGLDDQESPKEILAKAEERFLATGARRMSIVQTKHQLRDDVNRWKEKHEIEAARCHNLSRRIDEYEHENAQLKEQLRETRARVQDGYRDRQKLERTIQELRSRRTRQSDGSPEATSPASDSGDSISHSGLRELKLVRTNSQKSTKSTKSHFSKRSSSLGLQSVLSTENNKPVPEDTLLLELVNAKTAEAVAKQELEEVKAKLDSLRRMIGGSANRANHGANASVVTIALPPSSGGIAKTPTEPVKQASGGVGFFGWGRRTASTSTAVDVESK